MNTANKPRWRRPILFASVFVVWWTAWIIYAHVRFGPSPVVIGSPSGWVNAATTGIVSVAEDTANIMLMPVFNMHPRSEETERSLFARLLRPVVPGVLVVGALTIALAPPTRRQHGPPTW